MKHFLLRGALAGVVGSFASVAALLFLGESSIRDAIALEDAAAVPGEAHEEMFSRTVQVLGGSLGMALYGVFVGLIFAVVFAANRHRLGQGPDWRRARRLGVIAFVTVYLVPFLKYPPNPPAVGDPETVGQRTVAYLSLLAVAVLAALIATVVLDRLRARGMGEHLTQPAAFATWAVLIAVAYLVLPVNGDAITIDGSLLWSFRVASLAGQAVFWAVTATAFGLLTVRDEARAELRRTAGVAVNG